MIYGEFEVFGSEVQITGIGLLVPGEVLIVDESTMRRFERVKGMKIGEVRFSGKVQFTMVVEG